MITIYKSFVTTKPTLGSIRLFFALMLFACLSITTWGQTSYTSTSDIGAWNTSRWNNSSDAAPYTSAFTANNAVHFTSGTYSIAGMGAAIGVGNITLSNGVTVNFTAAANSIGTNGVIRTYDIGSGGLLDFGSQAFATAAGTGLIKNGTGALALLGAAYPGGFTLNGGAVVLRGVNAFGSGALVLNGGTICATNNRAVVAPSSITIGGNLQFGEVPANISIASNTATISFSDNIDLGGATRTFTLGNAAAHTFSGIISNGGLNISANGNGTGSFILSGTNSYASGLTLNSGTLIINNSSALGATAGTFTINGGSIDCTAGADVFSATHNPITIGGNFTFLGTLRNLGMGSGAISLGNSTTRTITNSGTTYISFPGAISGTGSTLNVTNSNTGNVLFSGNNSFTGGMTLDGSSSGRAQFSQAVAFPTSGTITINNAGGFRLTATGAPSYGLAGQSIICNPTQTATGSITQQNTDNTTATLLPNCTLNADTRVDVNNSSASSMIMAGDISGTGKLIKGGPGTLTLSGNNSFNGGISIVSGFLRINGGAIAAATNVDVASGCSFRIVAGSHTINNLDLSGGGGLTVDAGATLTITGTFTPGTGTINNQGTIVLKGSAAQTFPGVSAVINNGTLNQLTNLTIDNANGVSLNKSFTVVGTLTLTDGALSIGSNTLTLNGAVSGVGTISGSTTSNLTIGGTAGTLNFTSGSRSLNNLTIGSGNSATLGTALDIYGVLTATGGTLDVNSQALSLKSTSGGTARVADLTGSTLSNAATVSVERYIPNTGRKWRFLTAPVTGASGNTVFANWQNNGTVSAGTGVAIWGTGGTCDPGVTAGNGLVLNAIGASSSMRRYNSSTNLWENVTNTVTETIFDGSGNKAFALFVTGHFGGAYTTVGSGSIATTLRATGSVITGTKAFNFDYGDNAEHIAMIGNPYASPVNFFNLTRSNVNDKFWVWDPSLDGTGGYVLLTGDGSGNYTPSIVSGYSGSAAAGTVYEDIQSGQAIFVEATAAGAASVTFEEADKVSTTHVQVFRSGTQTEKLRVNLLNAANPAAIKVIDGVLVQYSNSFSNGHAAEDGIKLYNDRENLWVDANGKEYMIEGRKLIDNSDSVKLTTWALQQQAYRLEIIGSNFATDANLSAFLKDKFLGTETAISLSGTTEYPFTVTADAGSKAIDRFMVVFRSNASLPVTLTNVKAYQQNSGISVEWNTQSESGMQQYEVEKSANGTNFVKVNTTAAKSGTTNSYNFFDATPFSGANYYRIKAISLNGDVKYSSIVVVRLNTKGTKVTLYPNPVKGDQINLELSGLEKGNYTVSLFNQLGQQVMNRSIQHNGTNATQTINIGTIPSGVYELRLANDTTAVTQKLIKE